MGLQLGKENTARDRQAISTKIPRKMGGSPAPGAPPLTPLSIDTMVYPSHAVDRDASAQRFRLAG